MKTSYSDNPIHKLIQGYAESEGGSVEDVCEDYFTLTTPSKIGPIKYTYKPTLAKESKIELIATGSRAFEGILDESIRKGILCSIKLKNKMPPETFIADYFKAGNYQCETCQTVKVNDVDEHICTKVPRCYHKINNANIRNISITERKKIHMYQFYYSVFFNSKLKKYEEIIPVLIDADGEFRESILFEEDCNMEEYTENMRLEDYDWVQSPANKAIDKVINERLGIINLQQRKEINSRLTAIVNKLEEEKIHMTLKKKGEFDENEWESRKLKILDTESKSMKMAVSVKLINLFVIHAEIVDFNIILDNKAQIFASYIDGFDKQVRITCPSCKKEFYDGYGTEDGHYLCYDCINQSIETKKLYSKEFDLVKEKTTGELIEKESGIQCTVCGSKISSLFGFKCKQDNSDVCYSCFESCKLCDDDNCNYSLKNLIKSPISGENYCKTHKRNCIRCNRDIGEDECIESPISLKIYCHDHIKKCTKCLRDVGDDEALNSPISGKVYCKPHIRNCIKCNRDIGENECIESPLSKKIYCQDHLKRCIKCLRLVGDDEVIESPLSAKIYCNEHSKKCERCQRNVGVDEVKKCFITGKEFCKCTVFAQCDYCKNESSKSSLIKSSVSPKLYCSDHLMACEDCGISIGLNEFAIDNASGKKVCIKTRFQKCSVCEQVYALFSLREGKCPACSGLKIISDISVVSSLQKLISTENRTKKWLFGKNEKNAVVIAKGSFSDTLYVIKDSLIVFAKKLSLLEKLRGY